MNHIDKVLLDFTSLEFYIQKLELAKKSHTNIVNLNSINEILASMQMSLELIRGDLISSENTISLYKKKLKNINSDLNFSEYEERAESKNK